MGGLQKRAIERLDASQLPRYQRKHQASDRWDMRRLSRCFALGAALGLSACASHDLNQAATLRPIGEDRYIWSSIADATYPIDDPIAEAKRLQQLDLAMERQGCPAFVIIERTAQVQIHGLFGDIGDIAYLVECHF